MPTYDFEEFEFSQTIFFTYFHFVFVIFIASIFSFTF